MERRGGFEGRAEERRESDDPRPLFETCGWVVRLRERESRKEERGSKRKKGGPMRRPTKRDE